MKMQARMGDLITITQACPISALRGVQGQAHTCNPDDSSRVRIQLLLSDELMKQEPIRQWSQCANEVGLTQSEYIICHQTRKVMLATSSNSEAASKNPYFLNAIFDSGANTFLSPVRALFTGLKALQQAEAIEGLDGHTCEATHKAP